MNIGILGTTSGVGVTHLAISLASALAKTSTLFKRKKIAVVELNDSGDIKALGVEEKQIPEDDDGDYYTLKNIDYYPSFKQENLPKLQKNRYDYTILDCGHMMCDAFGTADIALLVCSSREWKCGSPTAYENYRLVSESRGLDTVTIVMPFSNKRAKREIEEFARGAAFYYPPYEEDPLSEPKVNIKTLLGSTPAEDKSRSADDEAYARTLQLEAEKRILEDRLKKEEEKGLRQKRQAELSAYKATHDELTGLGNRAGFNEAILVATDYVIVGFDVNNLKKTNDTLGHQKGDILITTIAAEISKIFPNTFRTGGDEFISIVNRHDFSENALRRLDILLSRLSTHSDIVYEVAHGYAYSTEAQTADDVIKLADDRMYEDKKKKKMPAREAREEEPRTALSFFEQMDEEFGEEDEGGEEEEEEEQEQEQEEAVVSVPEPIAVIPDTHVEPDTHVIFGTTAEEGADQGVKKMSAYWYNKETLFLEHNTAEGKKSLEVTLYVFPLELRKPNVTVPVALYARYKRRFDVSKGKPAHLSADGMEFDVSLRFTPDGEMVTGIQPCGTATLLSRQTETHKGTVTPERFGLVVGDTEYFPISNNYNGTVDSLAIKGDEVFVFYGTGEDPEGHAFDIVCGGDRYEVVYQSDKGEEE